MKITNYKSNSFIYKLPLSFKNRTVALETVGYHTIRETGYLARIWVPIMRQEQQL